MLACPKGFAVITGKQIGAARALLGMTQADLAGRAGLSLTVIERLEVQSALPGDDAEALSTIEVVLHDADVTLIDERATSAAGGGGVRLSAPASKSVDTNDTETVQYPEMARNGPFGAGG